MYAYIFCVWLKMLIILQTQELSWTIGSLFVQVVIIRGINFGHYLTLLCTKALCLKITQGLDSSIKRTWSLGHYTKAMIPTWTLHKS